MTNQPKPKAEENAAKVAEKPAVEYSLILGIRRIKEGPFAGLWELTELQGDVSVKRVLTDANTRGLLVSLAARAIGNAV